MDRRGSRTLYATDMDSAHAWLTRPPSKAATRDTIASAMVFLSAGVMTYGINGLSATPATKGSWFVILASATFGVFAEVFRRWQHD